MTLYGFRNTIPKPISMSERDVAEKIDNDYYKNKGDYSKIHKDIEEKKALLTAFGSYYLAAEQAGFGADAYAPGIVKKVHEELENYDYVKLALKEYNQESNRLHSLFKEDLEKEFKVQDNPKKDKLFAMAYERGHSSGYEEIFNIYSDLVELIK